MSAFGDDPELVATFRAEVEERIASLTAGLLALEGTGRVREAVTGLCRDAHTVKGSARMLGLDEVVAVAHRMEDVLAALRDGRLSIQQELVDLLLRSCDAIAAGVPGLDAPPGPEGQALDAAVVTAALDDALGGVGGAAAGPTGMRPTRRRLAEALPLEPLGAALASEGVAAAAGGATSTAHGDAGLSSGFAPVARSVGDVGEAGGKGAPTGHPAVATNGHPAVATNGHPPAATNGHPPAAPTGHPAGNMTESPPLAEAPTASHLQRGAGDAPVRVSGRRVRTLLDAIGEAELGGRRLAGSTLTLLQATRECAQAVADLRRVAGDAGLPTTATRALARLTAATDQLLAASTAGRELAEDHRDRLTQVREEAIGLAMVPVRRVLSGFPRLVHDLGRRRGVPVQLCMSGEDVEIDKFVLDAVADALTHLVTNAVDHGVESAEERRAAGKALPATVSVRVRGAGGTVTIEVADDGRGVDEAALRAAASARGLSMPESDAIELLFAPAVSTAATVSETSGRGMGLDSVRVAVEALGGSVSVFSEPGRGTTFTVTVPVTLGVLRCLLVRLGRERYAVPVTSVVETVSLRSAACHSLAGAVVLTRGTAAVPVIDLSAALGVSGVGPPRSALVTRHAGAGELAWAVEDLEGEAEMVVSDLGAFLGGRVHGVTGVTIDADGHIVCVLDLREVALSAVTRLTTSGTWPATAESVADDASSPDGALAGGPAASPPLPAAEVLPPRILVVEDSLGVRELERTILQGAGYRVETAVDGTEGAARLRGVPADLVLTDVEMPGMDGFTLTRTLRTSPGWENVPVVIMTSCGSEEHRREGLLAGASAYLLKHDFDQVQLVETVRRLLGR